MKDKNKIQAPSWDEMAKILKKDLELSASYQVSIAAHYTSWARVFGVENFISSLPRDGFSEQELNAIENAVRKCAAQAGKKLKLSLRWVYETEFGARE